MASPTKQRGAKTSTAKNDVDELPVSKDLRVKGSEARIILLCRKAINSKPTPWDKEDLLDFLYWMRQIIAILAGVAWGLVPLTGLYALLGFMALMIGAPFVWYQSQRIDEEEFGGHGNLASEGSAPALALFLLVWIVVYTFVHFG
ncbi:g11056 [Coccomyxa elongata]